MRRSFKLTSLVLVSTVFFASVAVAADVTVCNFPTSPLLAPGPPPILTSINGSFSVTATGCVRSQATNGIDIDAAATVTLDAGNKNEPAVYVTGVGNNAFDVTAAGTITAGSNIISSNGTAIEASAALTLMSSAFIEGNGAVDLTSMAASSMITNTGLMSGISGQTQATVRVAADSLMLTNASGGTIEADNTQNAVELNTGATNATISNIGSINAFSLVGNDGILVNDTTAMITNSGSITAQASAIAIGGGGTNASVTNTGTLSGGSTQATVLVAANAFSLMNNTSGSITTVAGNSAVMLMGAATGAAITNSGTITGMGGLGVAAINNAGPGFMLTNNGTITATGGGDALQLNENDSTLINGVTTVTNNAGGTISATGGNAININSAGVPGMNLLIKNSGTISQSGIGAGIFIDNQGFSGTIYNLSGGKISGFVAIDVASTATTGMIINDQNATITGGIFAITLEGDLYSINNAGTIEVTTGGTAAISDFSTASTITQGITNTGTIVNDDAQTQVTKTIKVTSNAINLQNISGTQVEILQQAGSIIGNVYLSNNGGTATPVLAMTGGTIVGTVTTSSNAGLNFPSILNLSGGSINYLYNPTSLELANSPGGNIVNLSGTALNDIIAEAGGGANTYNVSGGSFIALQENSGSDSVMNVIAPFTFTANTTVVVSPAPGNIISNLDTIHVASGVNFTVDTANNNPANAIKGLSTLNIDTNGSMVVNANIGNPPAGGTTINNNGFLGITNGPLPGPNWIFDAGTGLTTNNGALHIDSIAQLETGSYLQGNVNSQATYVVQLGSDASIIAAGPSGKILVGTGGAMLSGVIDPLLPLGLFIPNNAFYDIVITDIGLPVDNNTTLVQPDSAIVFFEKIIEPSGPLCVATPGGGCIVLLVRLRPFSEVVTCPNSQGIAGVLDVLSQGIGPVSPELKNLLGQLQAQTSNTIDSAVEQLAPQVNGALSNAADKSFDYAFASIQRRLEDLRGLQDSGSYHIVVTRDGPYGYSYGDDSDYESALGTWIYGAGTYFDQKGITCASGYRGDAATLAIGTDWSILDGGSRVGFVLNQTNTHSINKNTTHSIIDGRSTQGTVYVWFDPIESVYADVAVGFATHQFETRRNVQIGNIDTSAFGSFGAIEYGAQLDLGYAFLYDNAIIAPVMRARYTRFEPDAFTEAGAGDLDLNTRYLGKNEFLLGIGFRGAMRKGNAQVMYAPEISFMYFRELFNNLERAESNFTGGGPAFPTVQNRVERNRYVWGVGLNTHSSDKYVFSVKYEMEVRDHYLSNTGSLQLIHYWS